MWVKEKEISQINNGWLILLGICHSDTEQDISYLGNKIISLRGFCDDSSKMNLNVKQVLGSLLIVSQFTLYGNCHKGSRPSFTEAAPPPLAETLYQEFINYMKAKELPVSTGLFGAKMALQIEADGPVTLILESKKKSN